MITYVLTLNVERGWARVYPVTSVPGGEATKRAGITMARRQIIEDYGKDALRQFQFRTEVRSIRMLGDRYIISAFKRQLAGL